MTDNKNAVAEKFLRILDIIHRVVERVAIELEECQQCKNFSEEEQKRWKYNFGRETIISASVKLTGILNKIVPLVQVLTANTADQKVPEISKNDIEIIRRYLETHKKAEDLLALETLAS